MEARGSRSPSACGRHLLAPLSVFMQEPNHRMVPLKDCHGTLLQLAEPTRLLARAEGREGSKPFSFMVPPSEVGETLEFNPRSTDFLGNFRGMVTFVFVIHDSRFKSWECFSYP